MKHTFNKEQGTWYIYLPEFLEKGLGTKQNLMMVAGADTFLDILSNGSPAVKIEIETEPFTGYDAHLEKEFIGLDKELLESLGHPAVEYGGYYNVTEFNNNPYSHKLWLCPVTEFVFDGFYPKDIYIKKINL